MMGIKILDIITKLSFAFSILTYVIPHNTLGNYSIVYVMCIIGTYLGCYLKEKKGLYYVVGLLLLPGFFLLRGEGSVVFLILAIFSMYFIIIRYTGTSSYGFFIDNFKKGISVFVFIIFASFVTDTISFVNNISSFFMVIYFITSVILLRSLRHIENNRNTDKINKQNILYSILIVGFSLLITIEGLIQNIIHGIKYGYNLLVDLFMKVFYWVFIGVGYISLFIVEFFKKLFGNQKIEIEIDETAENTDDVMEMLKNQELIEMSPIIVAIIRWVIRIFVIVLIIYIINKIFKKSISKKYVKEEYIEESEFIKADKKRERKKKIGILSPRGEKEKIRYFYRKFLNKCVKENIPIVSEDTTEEINEKALNNYKRKPLDKLRSIYVEVRYGEKEVDKDTAKEYKKEYKQI